MAYNIVYESGPNDDGRITWSAYVLELPGCVSGGETREECERMIDEAIKLHLAEEMAARDHATDERIRQLVDQIDAWHPRVNTEDRQDADGLERARLENAGKPLIDWDDAKKDL